MRNLFKRGMTNFITLASIILALVLASCAPIPESERLPPLQPGYERIIVSIGGVGGRAAVTDVDKNDADIKVFFNDKLSETGTHGVFPVGSTVRIRVEGYRQGTDEQIGIGTASHTMIYGTNRVTVTLSPVSGSFILRFSYGEAANWPGKKSGLPTGTEYYKSGEDVTPPNADIVMWEYGNLDGWKYDDGSGEQEISGIPFQMFDRDTTLVAQWNPTQYAINYNADIPSGSVAGTPQEAPGANSFTMASDDNNDALSTYTDSTGNWAFGGWSTTNGGAKNITSKADIRSAVVAGSLQPNPNNGITLYAVWSDARTPFTVTVNADALGLGSTTIPNVMNTQDITTQVTDFLTGNANSTVKYELKAGNTITANAAQPTVTLSDTNVTIKVELQLADTIITATGNNPILDNDITVTFNDPGEDIDGFKWYAVGTALPTASISGTNAQKYAIASGWRTTTGTAQTAVTKDMAGQTLYPIGEEKVEVTVSSGNSYTLGNGGTNPFYVSKNTDITNQVKAFIPTSATTASNGAKKYTWNTSGQTTVNSGTNTTLTVNIDNYLTVETAFDVQVRFNNSNIGTAFYAFNGDDITNQIKNVVDTAGNLDNGDRRYGWNDAGLPAIIASSNTTRTYDVDSSSNNRLKVTAVQFTLSSEAIDKDAMAGMPGFTYSVDFTGTKDNSAWYNIGDNLPTPTAIMQDGGSGPTAANGYEFSGYWGETKDDTYSAVTEALAGKTLKAIVQNRRFSITFYQLIENDGGDAFDAMTNPATYSITIPNNLPTTVLNGSRITASDNGNEITIEISTVGIVAVGTTESYNFTCTSSARANGVYFSDSPDIQDGVGIPMGGGDFNTTNVTGNIYVGICWNK